MTERAEAPFTIRQILSINYYQEKGYFHPFTCSHCRDVFGTKYSKTVGVDHEIPPGSTLGNSETIVVPPRVELIYIDHKLVATKDGFICPTCDYTQNWCHSWMANWEWLDMNPFPPASLFDNGIPLDLENYVSLDEKTFI